MTELEDDLKEQLKHKELQLHALHNDMENLDGQVSTLKTTVESLHRVCVAQAGLIGALQEELERRKDG